MLRSRKLWQMKAHSLEDVCSSVNVDASGASEHCDHLRNCPNDLQNVLEQFSKVPEQQLKPYTPNGCHIKQIASDSKADALGASDGVEDSQNILKKLSEALEHVREAPERPEEEDSPQEATDDPGIPSGAMATPNDIQHIQEHSTRARNEHVDETIKQS